MITLSPTFKMIRKQLCLDVLEMIILCVLKIRLYYLLSITYICVGVNRQSCYVKICFIGKLPNKLDETAKLAGN